MDTIILDSPLNTADVSAYALNGRWGAARMYVNMPLVQKVGASGLVCGGTYTDASEWDLSGLREIDYNGIQGATVEPDLPLRLPKAVKVGKRGINIVRGKYIALGEGYDIKDGATLTLQAGAFSNITALAGITFGPYAAINVEDETVFMESAALREFVFEGRSVSGAALDAMLHEAAAIDEQTEPVVIYGSASLGWNRLEGMVGVETLSAGERAKMPNDVGSVLGVYVSGGVKKAWVVHRSGRFEPKGTVLIVR